MLLRSDRIGGCGAVEKVDGTAGVVPVVSGDDFMSDAEVWKGCWSEGVGGAVESAGVRVWVEPLEANAPVAAGAAAVVELTGAVVDAAAVAEELAGAVVVSAVVEVGWTEQAGAAEARTAKVEKRTAYDMVSLPGEGFAGLGARVCRGTVRDHNLYTL